MHLRRLGGLPTPWLRSWKPAAARAAGRDIIGNAGDLVQAVSPSSSAMSFTSTWARSSSHSVPGRSAFPGLVELRETFALVGNRDRGDAVLESSWSVA
jgi:hypothetical protein